MLSRVLRSTTGSAPSRFSNRLAPASQLGQKRFLNLHEYQSLQLFELFQVKVPKNVACHSVDEVKAKVGDFGDEVVIKSQVLAGGRGLGHFKESGLQGGVHVLKSGAEAVEKAKGMLGSTLVTKQTGEAGKPCNTVMLCEKFNIVKEKYFAILMDRSAGGPIMIGSKVGGTSIEDIAAETPEAIIKMPVDIMQGLSSENSLSMAKQMGFEGAAADMAADNIDKLYRFFIECDCTMVEINPFAELDDGRVIVCDAKVNFDDNAEFRQKEIHAKRDFTQEDPREVAAQKHDLNYIGLDGNIGCMVNGAGLAMGTMDQLANEGGSPANFLDVGGAAQVEQVCAAFEILQQDTKVQSILVNIFGGIMRCDVIAEGIVEAVKRTGLEKPLIVRLEGTNVEKGVKLISEANLNGVHSTNSFLEAARLAVKLAK